MQIISDNCFCEYTDHGHCGVLKNEDLDNDESLVNLNKQILTSVQAGADIVSPSGMLDGMVESIRNCLDANKYSDKLIMPYSTKFALALYGPFREAVDSKFKGDRKTYQLDYANREQAIRESLIDEKESADILMVKPGSFYLDILRDIKNNTKLPIAVYQVSGEYAMIKFSSLNNAGNLESLILESLLAFKRAGANLIISYFANDVKKLLN